MKKDRTFFKEGNKSPSRDNSKNKYANTAKNISSDAPKDTSLSKKNEINFNWSKIFINEDEYYLLKNKTSDSLKSHEVVLKYFT